MISKNARAWISRFIALFLICFVVLVCSGCEDEDLSDGPKDAGTLDFVVHDFEAGYYPAEHTLANKIVVRIIIHAQVTNNTGYDLTLEDLPHLTYDGCKYPYGWYNYETSQKDINIEAGDTREVLISEQYASSSPHDLYFIQDEDGYSYTGLDSAFTDELTNRLSEAIAGLPAEQERWDQMKS